MTSKYNQFDNTETMTSHHPQQPHEVPMVNVGYGQQNTMVHIQQPQYEVHVEERFTWCHFIMSIITFFLGGLCCCNPAVWVFSILGMVYSSNSYGSHGEKAWGRARHQNYTAKIFWILSLVITVITFVVLIIAVIVVSQAVKTTVKEAGGFKEIANNVYNQGNNYNN